MYLDEDGSGDVSPDEFVAKITLDRIHEKTSKFIISETVFVEKMLSEWYAV
jgi:hypothetical protein